ncbi:hypothetical protein [Thermochromatium tepidum]|uniref:Uncharacterized protein n=1 Tax=Thermochromatium tepidum ATCC 43061 TaxID=316276 RepID=A0A6I6DZ67_THETI|nr:hypothetical protein [Thermochromatium tepidum]QGU32904.1 hypothetical protein E6P07_07860 [Thermochromatium tepidum ATCC 43061]
MRKEYGKALRELFTARMKADFPEWRPVSAPKQWYWPGERVFVQDSYPGVWLVVVLVPDLKDHDAFYVEIGWSIHKRVPELSMRPCPDDPRSEAALNRDEYLCSLGELIPGGDKLHGDVHGWVIDHRTFSVDSGEILTALLERQTRLGAEQARAAVSPFVDNAIAALAEYGVPYLKSRLSLLAERRSNTLLNSDAQKPPAG